MTGMAAVDHGAGHASRRARLAIGLDVGGTKIAGGVVASNGNVLERIAPVSSPAADSDATVAVLRSL